MATVLLRFGFGECSREARFLIRTEPEPDVLLDA